MHVIDIITVNLLFDMIDIDECWEYKPCDQNCTNTIGSFYCGCFSGFEEVGDNRSCVGEYMLGTFQDILTSYTI